MKSSINSIFGIVLLSTSTPFEFIFWVALFITGITIPLIGSIYRVLLRHKIQQFLQRLKNKYKL